MNRKRKSIIGIILVLTLVVGISITVSAYSWTVSSQTNWEENTLSMDNTMLKRGVDNLELTPIQFFDGFESGDLSNWNGPGTSTQSVGSSVVKQGNYSLELTATDSIYRDPSDVKSDYLQFYVYFTSSSGQVFYLQVTETDGTNITLNMDILDGDLRHYDGSNWLTITTLSTNTWYNIEVRDFDWTNYTMDIYVNGTREYDDIDMRETPSYIGYIDGIQNADTSGTTYLDSFQLGQYENVGEWESVVENTGNANNSFDNLDYSASIGTEENLYIRISSYDNTTTEETVFERTGRGASTDAVYYDSGTDNVLLERQFHENLDSSGEIIEATNDGSVNSWMGSGGLTQHPTADNWLTIVRDRLDDTERGDKFRIYSCDNSDNLLDKANWQNLVTMDKDDVANETVESLEMVDLQHFEENYYMYFASDTGDWQNYYVEADTLEGIKTQFEDFNNWTIILGTEGQKDVRTFKIGDNYYAITEWGDTASNALLRSDSPTFQNYTWLADFRQPYIDKYGEAPRGWNTGTVIYDESEDKWIYWSTAYYGTIGGTIDTYWYWLTNDTLNDNNWTAKSRLLVENDRNTDDSAGEGSNWRYPLVYSLDNQRELIVMEADPDGDGDKGWNIWDYSDDSQGSEENVTTTTGSWTLQENTAWIQDEDGLLTSSELSTVPSGEGFKVEFKLVSGDNKIRTPTISSYTLNVSETTAEAWNNVESWSGSFSNSSSWSSLASWTGSIINSTSWNVVDTWNGFIEALANWFDVESWTGDISNSAVWHSIALMTGSISAPAVWYDKERWTGEVKNLPSWRDIESWNGNILNSPSWQDKALWNGSINEGISTWHDKMLWSGTLVNSPAWKDVDSWNGSISAVSGWNNMESWVGTVNSTGSWHDMGIWNGNLVQTANWVNKVTLSGEITNSSSFHDIESWTGSIEAVGATWNDMESWTGTIEEIASSWYDIEVMTGSLSNTASWRDVESWNGYISHGATWNNIESWSGSLESVDSWNDMETWTGTISHGANWTDIESWSADLINESNWNNIVSWNGSIKNVETWNDIESWNGTISHGAAWNNIQSWTGSLTNSPNWQDKESWNGTIKHVENWNDMEIWTGAIKHGVDWNDKEVWTGTIKTLKTFKDMESWNGSIEGTLKHWVDYESWKGWIKMYKPSEPQPVDYADYPGAWMVMAGIFGGLFAFVIILIVAKNKGGNKSAY